MGTETGQGTDGTDGTDETVGHGRARAMGIEVIGEVIGMEVSMMGEFGQPKVLASEFPKDVQHAGFTLLTLHLLKWMVTPSPSSHRLRLSLTLDRTVLRQARRLRTLQSLPTGRSQLQRCSRSETSYSSVTSGTTLRMAHQSPQEIRKDHITQEV